MGVNLGQTKDSRYYDADRYTPEQAENLVWWIVIIGDKEFPDESELDVLARDRRLAREVARAALARDFDPGVSVTKIEMA